MSEKLKKIVYAAVMAALCCVATIVIQIPTPMKGYINMGDAVVLVSACLLPLPYAAAASAVGSALADIITGYGYYAPATFIIKGLMALAAGLIYRRLKNRNETAACLTAGVAAELIMSTGYLLYSAAILGNGFAAAIASLPGDAVQGMAGIGGGLLIYNLIPDRKI